MNNAIKIGLIGVQAMEFIGHADRVRRDPAVVKAGRQAGRDVKQAAKSIGDLGYEVQASWRRHESRESDGGYGFAHA